MTNTRAVGSFARLGWFATTAALGVALVAGSLGNYRGARMAVATLNRGQADLLGAALWEAFESPGTESDSAQLEEFLDAHADAGVRYVALLDPPASVVASAGEPAAPPAPPPRDSMRTPIPIVEVGVARVRGYFPRPRLSSNTTRDRRVRRGRPPAMGHAIIEFEPVVATGMVGRARRSLLLACAGASILTLAAFLFWRISARYEDARLRLDEQRRLTLLGEMSAVLAHEIRNPLASLKGNAQLLAERLPDGSREKTRADRVVGEAARLEALTSDLLAFARSAPLQLESTDPVEVVRVSLADVQGEGIPVDDAHAPGRWVMDGGRMRQALVNVLQNAQQASPEGRPPEVLVREENGSLIYEIRDFGPGLQAGSEDRIFDPFFTTRTNGTGLGLAVAQRVAEMHGGALSAHNHADGGAVFRLVLPRGASRGSEDGKDTDRR